MNIEEFKTKAHVSQTIKNLFYEFMPDNNGYEEIQEILDEITDRFAEELAEFIVEARYNNSQIYNLKMLIELYGKVLDSIYENGEFLK